MAKIGTFTVMTGLFFNTIFLVINRSNKQTKMSKLIKDLKKQLGNPHIELPTQQLSFKQIGGAVTKLNP